MSHVVLVQFRKGNWAPKLVPNYSYYGTLSSGLDEIFRAIGDALNKHRTEVWTSLVGGPRWSINVAVMWLGVLNYGAQHSNPVTPLRDMNEASVRRILQLMNVRGWRDYFLVEYSENRMF
jgi:hypothetical protein